jgi:hypothetical protein
MGTARRDRYVVVIASAEEFEAAGRSRQRSEPVAPGVLAEVVRRCPELRSIVVRRSDVPDDVLAALRQDDDERVRWEVRSTKRWLEAHPDDADPWSDDPAGLIDFRLSDEERALLRAGLGQWGGPTYCTEELAVAMGFASVDHLYRQAERIAAGIKAGDPQSRTDWTRALIATEFVFVSNVFGAGWDWSTVTGFTDAGSLRILRQLQVKLVTAGVVGTVFGTVPREFRGAIE